MYIYKKENRTKKEVVCGVSHVKKLFKMCVYFQKKKNKERGGLSSQQCEYIIIQTSWKKYSHI